ncbi:MAG: hypothetical protein E7028_00430 [Planctomycetaceae bacterium]|nr:hypothetical protein [Planctomycetaceae bacterium]MBQ2822788.1 hypothetical protein [Thermoguttaceae bacterium]
MKKTMFLIGCGIFSLMFGMISDLDAAESSKNEVSATISILENIQPQETADAPKAEKAAAVKSEDQASKKASPKGTKKVARKTVKKAAEKSEKAAVSGDIQAKSSKSEVSRDLTASAEAAPENTQTVYYYWNYGSWYYPYCAVEPVTVTLPGHGYLYLGYYGAYCQSTGTLNICVLMLDTPKEGTPLANLGIERGDSIVKIDGNYIVNPAQINDITENSFLKVIKANGETKEIGTAIE